MIGRSPFKPSPEELAEIRKQLESFDTIDVVDPEIREFIEEEMPDLVHKLPPRKEKMS